MAKKSKAKRSPNTNNTANANNDADAPNGMAGGAPVSTPNGKPSGKVAAPKVVSKATSGKTSSGKAARGGGSNNSLDKRSRGNAAPARRENPLARAVETPLPPLTETQYWRIALVILIVGIALRQYRLADFPFHPDEAIHAWWTQRLMEGTYNFDPTYHGPVLYHLVAVIFAIPFLGINDYTARLVPSLLGIGLLALIVGPTRRWLGARGTLWGLALVALSPVIVAYHRRLLHDALVMFLTFVAVLCFQILRENPAWTKRGRWARVGLSASLSLFVATKANAFFIIAMLIAFWVIVLVQDWWSKQSFTRVFDDSPGITLLHRIVPLALFLFISIASYYAVRDPEVLARNEIMFKRVSVLGVLLMAQWLVISAPPNNLEAIDARLATDEDEADKNEVVAAASDDTTEGRDADSPAVQGTDTAALERRRAWQTHLLAAFVGLFLFAFMFGYGYLWWKIPLDIKNDPHLWWSHFTASIGDIRGVITHRAQPPYLQNAPDWDAITDALPKMLDYWGGQQSKPRLPGRHDYYIPLMVMYEFPIMLAGIYGIWRASRNRTPFTDLLLWWTFTSYVLYALANEKVPWLLCHIMLPLALLAGWGLAHLRLESAAKRYSFVVACVLSAIFLLRNISATNFERAGDNHEPILYAQTTDTFRDKFMQALQATSNDPGPIWPEQQWPAAWYLRKNAPWLNGSAVLYGGLGNDTPRMIVASEDAWKREASRFNGWKVDKSEYFIWPRPSWPALIPNRFFDWWLTRNTYTAPGEDTQDIQKGILAAPGEWSSNHVVIVTP